MAWAACRDFTTAGGHSREPFPRGLIIRAPWCRRFLFSEPPDLPAQLAPQVLYVEVVVPAVGPLLTRRRVPKHQVDERFADPAPMQLRVERVAAGVDVDLAPSRVLLWDLCTLERVPKDPESRVMVPGPVGSRTSREDRRAVSSSTLELRRERRTNRDRSPLSVLCALWREYDRLSFDVRASERHALGPAHPGFEQRPPEQRHLVGPAEILVALAARFQEASDLCIGHRASALPKKLRSLGKLADQAVRVVFHDSRFAESPLKARRERLHFSVCRPV